MKTQLREVVAQDHGFPSSGQAESTGYHKVITLPVQSEPTAVASAGQLYGKDDAASKAELHYHDEDSDEIQITRGGYMMPNAGSVLIVNMNGIQVIPAFTWTTLEFDTEIKDELSEFNTGTYTFTTTLTGIYMISVMVRTISMAAGSTYRVQAYSPSAGSALLEHSHKAGTGSETVQCVSAAVSLTAAQTVLVRVYYPNVVIVSGAAATCYFSIVKVA